MNNIKQIRLNFILSFAILLFFSGCTEVNTSSGRNKIDETYPHVAILLPLDGLMEELGSEYAKMIKMGIADHAEQKIKLSVYDSSSEENLRKAIKSLKSEMPDIIIGPLFSKNTKTLAPYFNNSNTIIISLSNDPTIAGDQTYILGHAETRGLEQVTDFMLKRHHNNFTTLFTSGKHSDMITKILKEKILNSNQILSRMEFYPKTLQAINQSVKTVTDNASIYSEINKNAKLPAVITTDDNSTIDILMSSIKKYNLDKKAALCGDYKIESASDKSVDIIYSGGFAEDYNSFIARAQKNEIKNLTHLHYIAYDAGLIVGKYLEENLDRNKFKSNLNSNKLLNGRSGKIYFEDNIAQRKYDIIQRIDGKYYKLK